MKRKLPPISEWSQTTAFFCPECGLECTAYSPALTDTHLQPSITHKFPLCPRFERVETVDDATEFMREARLKISQQVN